MQYYQFPEFIIGYDKLIACCIVIIGFSIGSYGEINFNWIGIIITQLNNNTK
jgi:hypothetical protein